MEKAPSPFAMDTLLASSHPPNHSISAARRTPEPPQARPLHVAATAVADVAAARRPVQHKDCTSGKSGYSGDVPPSQCKRAPVLEQNNARRAAGLTHNANGRLFASGSSDKPRMHRFSSSTSSKPVGKVKQIPAEEVTYLQRGKPFVRRFSSTASQSRHHRSITPPPQSRVVTVVKPTSPRPKPVPSVWSMESGAASKMLGTCEDGKSLGKYCVTPALTPSSRLVPLAGSIEPAPSTIDNGKISGRSCHSGPLQGQGQRSHTLASSRTELVTKPQSSSSISVLAAQPIKAPVNTKVESVMVGKAFGSSRNSATSESRYPGNAAALASLQTELEGRPTLLSPTSVLTEGTSTYVSPDTKAGPSLDTKSKCNPNSSQSGCRRSEAHFASLQEELVVKVASPTLNPVLISCSKDSFHDAKAASPPKGHSSVEDGKSFGGSCHNVVLQSQDFRESAPPPARIKPVSHTLLSMPLLRSNDAKALPPTKSLITTEYGSNKEASNKENIYAAENVCSDIRSQSGDCRQKVGPLVLSTAPYEKISQREACWKGAFEVIGEATHTYYDLEAHFPCDVFVKVYEVSRQMPEILKLEALSLSDVWPKIFKLETPKHDDIGLYFSSNLERPNRDFDVLLEKISSGVALRTCISDRQLVIYSSKLLPTHWQRREGKFYLWGAFQRFKKQLGNGQSKYCSCTIDMKTSKSPLPYENFHVTPELDMGIDVAGGRETGKRVQILGTDDVNEPPGLIARIAPPSFTTDSPPVSASQNASPGFAGGGATSGFAAQNNSPGLFASDAPASLSTKNVGSALDILSAFKEALPQFPADSPPGFAAQDASLRVAPSGASPGVATLVVSPAFAACHTLPWNTINAPLKLSTKSSGSSTIHPPTEAHPQIHSERPPSSVALNASSSFTSSGAALASAPQKALDIPPGFLDALPPGFTKDHCRFPTKKACADFASYSSPSSPIHPPTGAHSQIHSERLPSSVALNASSGFTSYGAPLGSAPQTALDIPPGFLDVLPPPGFTKAHCQFPTKKAYAGFASYSSPSICCSSSPGSETNPLTKFSLEVSRPNYPEVPPGFTKLPRVKQEPVSSSSNGDSENKKLLAMASGESSIRKAGKVDEVKIEHHEVTDHPETLMEDYWMISHAVKTAESFSQDEPECKKTRLISDILGISSTCMKENTRTLSEKPTPEIFREVGKSTAVPLSRRVQEREKPGKEKHATKRDLQEACHSSRANTAKRHKLNGRIALNVCSDGTLGKAARMRHVEVQKKSIMQQALAIDPEGLNSKRDQGQDKMRYSGTPSSAVAAPSLFQPADVKNQRDAISRASQDNVSPELSLAICKEWPAIPNKPPGPLFMRKGSACHFDMSSST